MNVTRSLAADGKTIKLTWPHVPNAAGFQFAVDGRPISHTMDGTRTSARFSIPDDKPHEYEVRVLGIADRGATVYPDATPPTLIGISPGAGDAFTTLSTADLTKSLTLWKQLGATIIRFDVWGESADAARMHVVDAAGLEAVLLVASLKDPAAYAARCAAVADMAAQFGWRRYELGNEPNLNLNALGGIAGWVAASNAGYKAIKAKNPQAVVATGGIAAYGSYGSKSTDGNRMDMQLAFEHALAAGLLFDAVATHPYFFGDGMTAAQLEDRTQVWHGLGQTLDFDHSIRATLDKQGLTHTPIWLTECGVPTTGYGWAGGVTEQAQADWLAWYLAAVRGEPRIELAAIYSGRDRASQADNREGHFGLLRADWSTKPSAAKLM